MKCSTNGEAVKPERWCAGCGEAIEGEAEHHDGELVCRPCWAAHALQDAIERLDDALADCEAATEEVRERQEQFDEERADLDREYDADMAELRAALRARTRAVTTARERVARYEGMATPPPPPSPTPIADGAYEPTAEDWADYRAWCDRIDAADWARRIERAPESPYGYE